MQCLRCNTVLKEREGRFGEFYYCPNQNRCGMKTTTKTPNYERSAYSVDNSGSVYKEVHPTGYTDYRRPFEPELDDPYFDDSSDYRPW